MFTFLLGLVVGVAIMLILPAKTVLKLHNLGRSKAAQVNSRIDRH